MVEMTMIKMKKIVLLSAVRCYRSACAHPFVVAALCFLVFLYRLSPFVFSVLVSTSPVLICTALLLGILLSLGQPNLPEIERDDPDIVCLKTGLLGDTTVVHSNELLDSVANETAEVVRGDSSVERGLDWEHQDLGVSEDDVRKMSSNNDDYDDDDDDDDEDVEMQNDRSPAESFGSERVNVDSLDSPPGSPWKHVEDEEPNSEDDEGTDSGSDGAESSSPDASMADIIPMLDELHPLLEEDAPHPAQLECGSDSDENIEKDEPGEAVDEDADDDEDEGQVSRDGDDEDEGPVSRDDQTKSAITWTEEDQKNLMDLGTSELERNQRLESLIARRRARKILVERNLIDFESTDLPFNVPPIATARNNPFDVPHHDMGLPPIPGSAPSILLARRNPFDLPYDSNEEKPDLLGDSFEQEFEPREPFFRRHESFNMGPSYFVPSRLERHDGRLRPYFAAEKMHSEGTSYTSFQRQLSGLSESKESSVPDTDSAGDYDANILLREQSLGSVDLKDSSRDFDYRNISTEDVSHESDGSSVKDDKTDSEIAMPLDEQLISNIEHVSEHVGHGSQTSEETDALDAGESDKEGNGVDIDSDSNLISFEEEHASSSADLNVTETSSSVEAGKQDSGHRSQTSEEADAGERDKEGNCVDIDSYSNLISFEEEHASSSADLNVAETSSSVEAGKQDSGCISQVRERTIYDKEGEGLSSSEVAEDAKIVMDEGSSCHMTADILHKEPVYDSSPPADNLYVPSDLHVELEMHPILRTVSFAERELESSRQDLNGSSEEDVPKIFDSGDDQPASITLVAEPSSDTKSSQESAVQGDITSKTETEGLGDQSSSSIHTHILAANVPHAEIQTMLEHSVENETALLTSDADVARDALIETEEKQISVHSVYALEEAHIAEYGEELVYLDKSVDEASSSRENHRDQNAAVMHEGLTDQSRSSENLNSPVGQEIEQEVITNINSPTSPESISVLSEACESRAAEGYSDVESNAVEEFGDDVDNKTDMRSIDDDDDVEEMKEFDEALLSELDAVGDFSITNQGSSSHQLENVVASADEDSPKSRDVHVTNMVDRNPQVQVVEAELRDPVEATTLDSSYDHQYDSPSLTDSNKQSPIAETEPLQPANFDYGQSSVHIEEIKDFGQTSSELPVVEAGGQTSSELPVVEAGGQTSSELSVVEAGGQTSSELSVVEAGGQTSSELLVVEADHADDEGAK